MSFAKVKIQPVDPKNPPKPYTADELKKLNAPAPQPTAPPAPAPAPKKN